MYYRVTKYNPAYRNDNGNYSRHEWISFSQIGEIFNGSLFTKEDYLSVEQAYVNSIMLFIKNNKEQEVYCSDFKNFEEDDFYTADIRKVLNIIKTKGNLSMKELRKIIPFVLRGHMYFIIRFRKTKYNYVAFGYDYYMYFNSEIPINKIENDIRNLGLFVEELSYTVI